MAEFEAESQDYLIKLVQSGRYCAIVGAAQ